MKAVFADELIFHCFYLLSSQSSPDMGQNQQTLGVWSVVRSEEECRNVRSPLRHVRITDKTIQCYFWYL